MGRTIERYFIPLLVGLAPIVLMLMTWAPDGRPTGTMMVIRSQSLPILMAELIVILVASREGLVRTLRGLRLPVPALAAAIFLAGIALATAFFFAPNPVQAQVRTAYWIIHILFGLSVMHLSAGPLAATDFYRGYALGFVIFVLLFALFVVQVRDPANFDWTRGLPASGHIRHYGYYAAAVAALGLGTMALAGKRAPWIAAFVVSTVAFGFAFWTGSRGAIAAAVAALVAGLVLVPELRRPQAWAGGLASLLASILIVYWLPAPAAHMGLTRTVTASAGAQETGITTGRTDLWSLAFDAIMARPWFGYGEAQMSTVATFSTMVHPHNVVLQILLAWGIVGTLCVAVLILYLGLRTFRNVRAGGGDRLPAFVAMLAIAAYSLYDGTLYHVLPVSLFAACAGIVARDVPHRPDDRMTGSGPAT